MSNVGPTAPSPAALKCLRFCDQARTRPCQARKTLKRLMRRFDNLQEGRAPDGEDLTVHFCSACMLSTTLVFGDLIRTLITRTSPQASTATQPSGAES